MKERQLTRMSGAGAILSLILIFIFVSYVGSPDVKIGDITFEHDGKTVRVTGMVSGFRVKDGNAFFTISDETGDIMVVVWESVMEQLLQQGDAGKALQDNVTIVMEGEVDVYRGTLEIVPLRPTITIID